MSDKNLGQRINITFCVKIGKSTSETPFCLSLRRVIKSPVVLIKAHKCYRIRREFYPEFFCKGQLLTWTTFLEIIVWIAT